jgi:hypothetical protein
VVRPPTLRPPVAARRRLLLAAAAVALVTATALVLVPFRAELSAVGRDGRPVDLTVAIECRAPVLDASGSGAPTPCVDRARQRSAGGALATVVGLGLLAGGLRGAVPLEPAERQVRRW